MFFQRLIAEREVPTLSTSVPSESNRSREGMAVRLGKFLVRSVSPMSGRAFQRWFGRSLEPKIADLLQYLRRISDLANI